MKGGRTVAVIGEVAPPVNGMNLVTGFVIDEFRRSGWHPVLLVWSRSGAAWQLRLIPVRAHRICSLLARSLALVPLRMKGVRHLYMPCDSGAGLIRILATVAFARALGFEVALHHHVSRYFRDRSLAMRAIAIVGGRRCSHVVLCEWMREQGRLLYGFKTTNVLTNSVFILTNESEVSKPRERTPNERPRIGMLANLTVDKGVNSFLRAAGSAALAHCDFVLAGPTEDPALEAAIHAHASAHPNFSYVGPVHGPSKEAFLASLDVMYFPTQYRNEAEPLVLWEAARHGARLVSTAVGCIPDQLSRLEGVLIHEGEGHVEAIRKALSLGRVDPRRSSPASAFNAAAMFADLTMPPGSHD